MQPLRGNNCVPPVIASYAFLQFCAVAYNRGMCKWPAVTASAAQMNLLVYI